MKGTELFVKALQKEGIDFLFAYPGGYAIDIFDELYKQDSIQVILPRHEQGRYMQRMDMQEQLGEPESVL